MLAPSGVSKGFVQGRVSASRRKCVKKMNVWNQKFERFPSLENGSGINWIELIDFNFVNNRKVQNYQKPNHFF